MRNGLEQTHTEAMCCPSLMKIPGAHSCQAPGRAVCEGVRTSVGQQSLKDPLRAPCMALRNFTGTLLL